MTKKDQFFEKFFPPIFSSYLHKYIPKLTFGQYIGCSVSLDLFKAANLADSGDRKRSGRIVKSGFCHTVHREEKLEASRPKLLLEVTIPQGFATPVKGEMLETYSDSNND